MLSFLFRFLDNSENLGEINTPISNLCQGSVGTKGEGHHCHEKEDYALLHKGILGSWRHLSDTGHVWNFNTQAINTVHPVLM